MQLRAGRALHIGSAREPACELSPDGQERSRGAPGLLALPSRESRLQPKGPRTSRRGLRPRVLAPWSSTVAEPPRHRHGDD